MLLNTALKRILSCYCQPGSAALPEGFESGSAENAINTMTRSLLVGMFLPMNIINVWTENLTLNYLFGHALRTQYHLYGGVMLPSGGVSPAVGGLHLRLHHDVLWWLILQ